MESQRLEGDICEHGAGKDAQSEFSDIMAVVSTQSYQSGNEVVHYQQCLYFNILPIEFQQSIHYQYCQHTVNSGIHSLSAMSMASTFHQWSAHGICRYHLYSIILYHVVSMMSVSHQRTISHVLPPSTEYWWCSTHYQSICGMN